MDAEQAEQARTIGLAVWRVRDNRRKSLRVAAELAGMSKDSLQRIETGERSPTLREIQGLAEALEVSVSDLTRLPVPAPANGHTESTIKAIGLALDAIDLGRPGGLVVPVAVLRDRVTQLHAQRRACRFAEVATALPGLIRDVHTTLATGADHAEVLELAVYLHVHVTLVWLSVAAAPNHLRRRAAFLARRLAEEHGAVTVLGMAGFVVTNRLLAGGAFELGKTELEALTLPPTTAATAGLVCALTTTHALAAVLDGRPDDATAPLETARELAERFGTTGDTGALGFLPAPADVAVCRMWLALEADDPDHTVSVAQDTRPEHHPFPAARSQYWKHYGRALARLRGRHDDAVRALRTAEQIYPTNVSRDPLVRDTLAVLLRHTRRGTAADEELRSMARRAGLPV